MRIETLGTNLKRIRRQNQMTQHELAVAINSKQGVISKIESNKSYPSINRLILIATLLSVGLDDLVR
jgi:transcriptional regulator with XRE-family HTH domain